MYVCTENKMGLKTTHITQQMFPHIPLRPFYKITVFLYKTTPNIKIKSLVNTFGFTCML